MRSKISWIGYWESSERLTKTFRSAVLLKILLNSLRVFKRSQKEAEKPKQVCKGTKEQLDISRDCSNLHRGTTNAASERLLQDYWNDGHHRHLHRIYHDMAAYGQSF